MDAIISELAYGARSFLRNLKAYLMGRGLITTGAALAGILGQGLLGASAAPYMFVALAGGAVLSGILRLRDMRFNLDEMAGTYRTEIAQQLGIAPEEVTRTQVHTMAYGDPAKGIAPNPILREEIEREWGKTWLKFATSMVAATASFALVLGTNLGGDIASYIQGISVGGVSIGQLGAKLVNGVSTLLLTGTTGLLLNNGLDMVVQSTTALGRTTAHDKIARMNRDVAQGRMVSPEQVFAVFVSANPELSAQIKLRTGKSYDTLPLAGKRQVIEALQATAQINELAAAVNNKEMSAGSLAFIVTGQRGEPKAVAVRAAEAQTRAPAVAAQVPPAIAVEESQPPISSRPSFAERVAPARNTEQSAEAQTHAERESLRRQAALLDQLVASR